MPDKRPIDVETFNRGSRGFNHTDDVVKYHLNLCWDKIRDK